MSAFTQPTPPVPTPARPTLVAAPPPPKKSKALPIGLLLLIVAAAAGYWVYSRNAAKPDAVSNVGVRTGKAVAGPLMVSVRLAGSTSSRIYSNITAPNMQGRERQQAMNILYIAKSGAIVKKGEQILVVDGQQMQDHVDDLAETIAQAVSDVKRREAEQAVEWEGMQQTLRVSKASLDKANWDFKAQEVRSDVERELLKLSVEEASARYKQQLNDVANRKSSQQAELKILQITEERHTRHRNRHLNDLKRFVINSPMDGLVVMQSTFRGGEFTPIQQGDLLNPGQSVMRVVDLRSMQVEANINQSQTSLLRIGQPVTVGFDAFGDMKLKGKIYSVGALAVGGWRQQYYIRNVPVRIQIDEFNPKVIPDLSAYGDVEIGRTTDGVHIPLGSIVTEEGKTYVMLKGPQGFEKHAVTLGERSNTHVIIQAGLNPGDEVRINN